MQDSAQAGQRIAIVDFGGTHLVRLQAALRALGHDSAVAAQGAAVAEAPVALLGGAGDVSTALRQAERTGISEALKARAQAGLPTLAIGLGAHLLCEGILDGGHRSAGLGLLPGVVRRLPEQGVRGEALKTPHMGWGAVKVLKPSAILPEDGWFYFAHELVIDGGPSWEPWALAQAEHTLVFPALVQAGSVVGAAFHPELSGASGLGLLRRFLS